MHGTVTLKKQNVTIIHDQMMEDGLPKHGFVALDPGGYYLQFVRFNSHPENTELLAILNKLKSGYAEPPGTRRS